MFSGFSALHFSPSETRRPPLVSACYCTFTVMRSETGLSETQFNVPELQKNPAGAFSPSESSVVPETFRLEQNPSGTRMFSQRHAAEPHRRGGMGCMETVLLRSVTVSTKTPEPDDQEEHGDV